MDSYEMTDFEWNFLAAALRGAFWLIGQRVVYRIELWKQLQRLMANLTSVLVLHLLPLKNHADRKNRRSQDALTLMIHALTDKNSLPSLTQSKTFGAKAAMIRVGSENF